MFNEPLNSTKASFVAKASNLFGAVTNLYPVSFEISSATYSAKPSYVLRPVPTAVPPWASWLTYGNLLFNLSIQFLT